MRVSVTGDKPDTPDLSDLEQAVLSTALAGDGTGMSSLRRQLPAVQVMSRTLSGVGFVTRVQVADELPAALPVPAMPIVRGEHPELPGGAEFLLQLKDGRLHTIEAFCFEGIWPADESAFRLSVGD